MSRAPRGTAPGPVSLGRRASSSASAWPRHSRGRDHDVAFALAGYEVCGASDAGTDRDPDLYARGRGVAHAQAQAALEHRPQAAMSEHLDRRRFGRDSERLVDAVDG